MGVGLPRGLSPSSFSAFKSCPLAFKFSYLDRLPQPPSAPASKGTLVHRALELLMLRGPADRTIGAALEDLAQARNELAADPDFTELVLTEAEWDGFHAEAETLVHRYFELEDPTAVRPIGLELRLAATVGSVQLRGIIDRLELVEDDELVITDYKTGAVPGERHELQRLAGVHMYALMVRADARQATRAGAAPLPLEARSDHRGAVRAVGHRRRPQDAGAVDGDRVLVRPGRLPPPHRAAVQLLHLPGVLPGLRRAIPALARGAARARDGHRAVASSGVDLRRKR